MSRKFAMGLRPISLILISLCGVMSHAHANSPVLAQTSIGISNVQFQFFDLNPTDTISPEVSFQSTGLIGTSVNDWEDGINYQNSLLPSTPITYVTPSGSSSVLANNTEITVQSQITLEQLLNQTSDINPNWLITEAYDEATLMIGSSMQFESFSLSAGTTMVVKGSLFTSAALNSAELTNELVNAGYDNWQLYMGGDSIGLFGMAEQMSFPEEGDGSIYVKQGNIVTMSAPLYQTLSHSDTSDSWSYQNTVDFEFVITNAGAETMDGIFFLNLSAMPSISLYAQMTSPPVTPPITVPPVPEPSTYALMGLGLFGVMAAARRRRAH